MINWHLIAKRLTDIRTKAGKLPFTTQNRNMEGIYNLGSELLDNVPGRVFENVYTRIIYSPLFDAFFYVREDCIDDGGYNVPAPLYEISKEDVLKEVWNYLTEDEKTIIMSQTLGAKND